MVRRTPARPSTAGEGTTTSQSRGGLFVDADEVGVNLSGVTGEQGPPGPKGDMGDMGLPGNDGADGAPGVSFVDIFFTPEFDGLGNLSGATSASINPTSATQWRAFVRTDNTRYFTNGDYTTFDASTFEADVPIPITGFSVEGPAGMDGAAGDQGPVGPVGPAGAAGAAGPTGADGLTFVPIFFTEDGGSPTNASLTEMEVHNFVTYYRSDNPFRILLFANDDGSNDYDFDNPQLVDQATANQTLQNNLPGSQNNRLGRHSLGDTGPMGATGPQGPEGNSISSVVLVDLGSNQYRIDVSIEDAAGVPVTTIPAGTFTVPQGPEGPQGTPGTPGTNGTDGTDGVSITSVTSSGSGLPGSTTTLTVTLSTGAMMNFSIPPGSMGAAGQGTSTNFIGGTGIDVVTDPNDPTRVTINSEEDAQSIQGTDLPGTTPGGGATDPQILEFVPGPGGVGGAWRYVNFPSGGTSANDAEISVAAGNHIVIGSNSQPNPDRMTDQTVDFTVNQADAETITIDVHSIDDIAHFRGPIDATDRTALVEAHVLRTALDEAQAPSGDQFPTSPAPEQGDEFILIGHATLPDGFYYYDGTDWRKDGSLINAQFGNWIITNDTSSPTSVNNTTREINLGDDHDPNRPIADWVSGTDYELGDQVIYNPPAGSQHNIPSIYIRIALTQEQIDAGVTFSNTTPPESGGGTIPGWLLLRSGIVALSTNDGAGDAGITSNACLLYTSPSPRDS